MEPLPLPTLEDAVCALRNAEEAFSEASNVARVARSEEIKCLNKLNEAQKVFDVVIKSYKSKAPAGSDWSIANNK